MESQNIRDTWKLLRLEILKVAAISFQTGIGIGLSTSCLTEHVPTNYRVALVAANLGIGILVTGYSCIRSKRLLNNRFSSNSL